jgi:hypothetical protein
MKQTDKFRDISKHFNVLHIEMKDHKSEVPDLAHISAICIYRLSLAAKFIILLHNILKIVNANQMINEK